MTVRCNLCSKFGDGYWAGEHTRNTGHNSWELLGDDEEYSSKTESNQGVRLECRQSDRDSRIHK